MYTTELQVTGLDLKNKTGILSTKTTNNKSDKIGNNTVNNNATTTNFKGTIIAQEKSTSVTITNKNNNNIGQAIQKDLSAKSEIYKMHTNGLMLLHAQRSTQGNGAKKSELTASLSTTSNGGANSRSNSVATETSEEEGAVNYHVWKKSSSTSTASSVLPIPAPLSAKQVTKPIKAKRNESSLSVADEHFHKTATTKLGIITKLASENTTKTLLSNRNKTAGTKRDAKSLDFFNTKYSPQRCLNCNLLIVAEQKKDRIVLHPTQTTANNKHHQRQRNRRQISSQQKRDDTEEFSKLSRITNSKSLSMTLEKVSVPIKTRKREVFESSKIKSQEEQPHGRNIDKRNSDNPLFDDDQPEQIFDRYTKEKRRLMKLQSRYEQADARGDVPPIAPIKAISNIKSRFDKIEPLEHFPRFAPFGPDAYDSWPRFGVPDLELKHYPRFGAPKMDDFELLPGIPHIRPLSRGDEATGSKRDFPEKPDDDFYDQELDDDVEHNSPITSPTSIPYLTNIPDIQDITDIPTIRPAAAAARRRSGNGEPAVDTIHTKDGDETRVST